MRVVVCLLLAVMSGCAEESAGTPSPYDGIYRPAGAPQAGRSGSACSTIAYPIIVRNGRVSIQFATATASGKIAADGTVRMYTGKVAITGKFTGTHFDGNNGDCFGAFDYEKVAK